MDCNLKKLANFVKFLMCILEKSLKTDFSSLLPQRNHFIFPSRFSNSDFTFKKGVLFQIFQQFWPTLQQLSLHIGQ